MSARLEERLGKRVRQEGEQTRYVCLLCGMKALLVHEEHGLWFCFGCEEGGGTTPAHRSKDKKKQEEFSFEHIMALYGGMPVWAGDEDKLRGIPISLLQEHGRVFSLQKDVGLAVKQTLLCNPTNGYLVWYPHHYPAYKTFGQRGFIRLSRQTSRTHPVRRIYLFEGIFDMFSVFAVSDLCGTFLCSMGSSLSDEQMSDLVTFAKWNDFRVVVCFDKDKVRPIVEITHALAQRGVRVALCIPPLEKDWNDELVRYPYRFGGKFLTSYEEV